MHINVIQVILLYGSIAGFTFWCFFKHKKALLWALIALLFFASLRFLSFFNASTQQKLIVYNIPKRQAIDFIAGRKYFFKGDSAIMHDMDLQNFHLAPSRILHRVKPVDSLDALRISGNLFQFSNKLVLIIDSTWPLQNPAHKIKVDMILLSKNAAIDIDKLINTFDCQQVVIDGTNTFRKIKRWSNDCVRLGIPYHVVSEQGAFVLNLH